VMVFAGVDAWFAGGVPGDRLRQVAVLAVVAMFGHASHAVSREFAERTYANGAIARAAVDAVARVQLPTPCHVYLLGIDPPSEWSAYVFPDSIVKALSPDLGRVGPCLFHGERITYVHFVPRDSVAAGSELPFVRALPAVRVGSLEMLYLRAPAPWPKDGLGDVLFLRYEDGTFREVSADVAARLLD
jgi:hypothetical protein